MGVNLSNLVDKIKIDFKVLSNHKIAIDAYNTLYQFLTIIRTQDGNPLKDNYGNITSHISGLFYRTVNIMEYGIKPIYVFDGEPPILKKNVIEKRIIAKKEAKKKYEIALKNGDTDNILKYAKGTARLDKHMVEESKELLDFLGIPWIQAPSEGEAQAAYIVKKGDADYCVSQDYDSLLFGAPKLLRNLTISGRRKIPRKNIYVEIIPEVIELDKMLQNLQISLEQLVDIGILLGTDFNPKVVKGIGPKTALKTIKKYKCIEKTSIFYDNFDLNFPLEDIRDIFLHPKVKDNYKLEWKEPDEDGLFVFLCTKRDFSEIRVKKAVEKAIKAYDESKKTKTLESWFT